MLQDLLYLHCWLTRLAVKVSPLWSSNNIGSQQGEPAVQTEESHSVLQMYESVITGKRARMIARMLLGWCEFLVNQATKHAPLNEKQDFKSPK